MKNGEFTSNIQGQWGQSMKKISSALQQLNNKMENFDPQTSPLRIQRLSQNENVVFSTHQIYFSGTLSAAYSGEWKSHILFFNLKVKTV